MHEKSQRRVVSKGQYVRTIRGKAILFVRAGLQLLIGLAFLKEATTAFTYLWSAKDMPYESGLEAIGLMPVCVGVTACLLFTWSKRNFVKARSIEPVVFLTERNAHLLPLQDTLVRSSNAPATAQQDSLLRAVQQHHGTPSEQLLRAGRAEIK